MKFPRLLRKRPASDNPGATPSAGEETGPVTTRGVQPPTVPTTPEPSESGPSAARLDELRAQAQYARQRYDLYKARSYGPRLTSPARLRDLRRECLRAEANLQFAKAEAKAAADAKAARRESADR